jgi:hypothetical protein
MLTNQVGIRLVTARRELFDEAVHRLQKLCAVKAADRLRVRVAPGAVEIATDNYAAFVARRL